MEYIITVKYCSIMTDDCLNIVSCGGEKGSRSKSETMEEALHGAVQAGAEEDPPPSLGHRVERRRRWRAKRNSSSSNSRSRRRRRPSSSCSTSRAAHLLASLQQTLRDKLQAAGVIPSPPPFHDDIVSLISNAYGYIEELKAQIAHLKRQDHPHGQESNCPTSIATKYPSVRIKTLQHGLHMIHATCKKWPGLLVAVLQHLETNGLDVSDANVSCIGTDVISFDALVSQQQGKDHLILDQLRTSIVTTILNRDSYALVG